MAKQTWETIGMCPVDSGLIMIVDPCYVMADEPTQLVTTGKSHGGKPGYDYRELLREMEKKENQNLPKPVDTHEIAFSKPYGTGVVFSNHIGDGVYPVQVRRNKAGGIVEARIKFF